MLTLIWLVVLALAILLSVKSWDWDTDIGAILAWIVTVILTGVLICYVCTLATSYTIDDKISMYEEENANIEQRIETVVQGYMDYESTTFERFKDEDAINLVSMFPELKSDTLVQQQMQVYADNNAKIKELKEQKISLSEFKWLLYFGR